MTTHYVDQDSGSDGNGGTGTGDAWLTLDYAFTQWSSNDKIFITGSGTYTTTLDPGNGGTINGVVEGYSSTPGDGGKATLTLGATTDLITYGADQVLWANLIMDGNGQSGRALVDSSTNGMLYNVEVTGFAGSSGAMATRCNCTYLHIHDNTCTGTLLINSGTGCVWSGLSVIDNTSAAIAVDVGQSGQVSDFVIHNSATGDSISVGGADGNIIQRGVIDGAGDDGIFINVGSNTNTVVREVVIQNCTGYGIGQAATPVVGSGIVIENCYGRSNTGGNNEISSANYIGNGVTALTADPFVDSASDDFNINNLAGGGAVLRAVAVALNGSTNLYPFRGFVSGIINPAGYMPGGFQSLDTGVVA